MKRICLLAGLLALVGLSALQAGDPQKAPASPGLPFSVVLTDKGTTAFPTSFELQDKGWAGSVELRFDGLRFADGELTGKAVLRNGSGKALEGLRLEVVGATEEFQTRQRGRTLIQTRDQDVSLASPLVFGNLPAGQESAAMSLTVRGINFRPETERVTVRGVLGSAPHGDR